MTATETVFIQIEWCLEDVSHDQSEPVTSKTTTNCIDASNKNWAFRQVLEFWKIVSALRGCQLPNTKDFFGMKSVVILTNGIVLFLLYHKMHKHLENLNNSVKHYFPNDQSMILQNHAWVRRPCWVQERTAIVM